jgi:hypothetical protein
MRADLAPVAGDGQAFEKGWMANIVTDPAGGANDQEFYYFENTGSGATNWKYGGKAGSTVDLTPYAKHGYGTGETVKTLKQVDDYSLNRTLKVNQTLNNLAQPFVDHWDNLYPTDSDIILACNKFPIASAKTCFTEYYQYTYGELPARQTLLSPDIRLPYLDEFSLSVWIGENGNFGGSMTGVRLLFRKGYNKLIKKDIIATISTVNKASIAADILNNGFYLISSDDNYTAKLTDYEILNELYFFKLELYYKNVTGIPRCDFIEFRLNSASSAGQAQYTFTRWFGLQYIEGDNFADQKTPVKLIKNTLYTKEEENTHPIDGHYNQWINYWYGTRIAYNIINKSYYTITGIIANESLMYSVSKSDKYNETIKISNNDSAIPNFINNTTRNSIVSALVPSFLWTEDQKANATMSFWIKRSDLKGKLRLQVYANGATWSVGRNDLLSLGYVDARDQVDESYTPTIIVDAIDGDYTHVLIKNILTVLYEIQLVSNNGTGTDSTSELTICNPVVIDTYNYHPYYRYKSKAETNGSKWIGKIATFDGDSQYNIDYLGFYLGEELGLTVKSIQQGGYMLAIRNSNLTNNNYNSFYHKSIRKSVLDIKPDLIIFTHSSNDGYAVGDLSDAAVQAVKDNYYWYGDDESTDDAKQTLFDNMDATLRQNTFMYSQCYSAWLKQISEVCPNSKVIICTIPVSAGSGTMTGAIGPDGRGVWKPGYSPEIVWNNVNPGIRLMREGIYEIARKHAVPVVDLYGDINYSLWNMTEFCSDGVHWDNTIRERIAQRVTKAVFQLTQ